MQKKGGMIDQDEVFYLALDSIGYDIADALDNPYMLKCFRQIFEAGVFFGLNSIIVKVKKNTHGIH